MNTTLVAALQQLDCTPRQIKFFIANYTLGPSSLSDITAKARLQRSTAYILADELVKKQLITHNFQEYKRLYIAASPSTLQRMLEARQRKLKRTNLLIDTQLAELQSLYGANEILPKVTMHQGIRGLLAIQAEILSSHQEILLWTNQSTERSVFTETQHRTFIDKRIKQGLSMRVLAVDTPEGRTLPPDDSASLRTTRLLPSVTQFSAETYLFNGDSVAILDFNTDIVGIVIHNPAIYTAQAAQFEFTWSKSA